MIICLCVFQYLTGLQYASTYSEEYKPVCFSGLGNTSYVCAEFNFGCDPEAAKLVLNGVQVPTTIFPWEINIRKDAGQPWASISENFHL